MIALSVLAALSVIVPSICSAQAPTATVTILHSFGDGSVPNDGLNPIRALIQASDGNFYGTTISGGSGVSSNAPFGGGTIFKITPTGTVTILHSFADGSVANDGQTPTCDLIQGPDGNIYGTTRSGGSMNDGTAFKMTLSGALTILHSFDDGTVPDDGVWPGGGLFLSADGNIYGTTTYGGSTVSADPSHKGYGTLFRMTLKGQVTILHSFNDGGVANDGEEPVGIIRGSDGNFYGTTNIGGSAGLGAVFEMSPDGAVTILHSFCDGTVPNDGQFPGAGLIERTPGVFYGTTENAIIGWPGTVFRITSSGQVTILHTFVKDGVANDGAAPVGGLIEGPDGNYYGTTRAGGSKGDGTVYTVTPAGQVTILHSFHDGSVANDGIWPVVTLTQGTDGSLYGTTMQGGSTGPGTVFKVTLKAATTIDFPAGLQMISLPYNYRGVGLGGILGYTGATLATWQPTVSEYAITPTAPANQIVPGHGYWVRFPQAVSITLPGAPVDTSKNFDIPLTKGWNMVGDPFLASLPVSSLLFNNGTETFVQAIDGTNPLIGSAIWTYSQASNQYTPATSLDPDQGYWILAFANTDVQIPHP